MHTHWCYYGRHHYQCECEDYDIHKTHYCGNHKYDDYLKFWRFAFPVLELE